ncbi:hypothetical protein CspHIS471_0705150 [Cutaneotrichosporon sp. HIS471]|nr:hypothetical protein CspHIS471_0705150 [Cutaneotrichosporon sp. HIS471]
MFASLALLSLAAAAPLSPTGSKLLPRDASRINWRGAANLDMNKFSVCSSGPILGYQNGNPIQITGQDNMYCAISFVFNGQFFGLDSQNTTSPEYCIDATLNPGNGVQPHAWECIDGAWQQNWVFHTDGRIELAGWGLCLDVTDGDTDKPIQLWECFAGNTNQQFDIGPFPGDYGTVPYANSTIIPGS